VLLEGREEVVALGLDLACLRIDAAALVAADAAELKRKERVDDGGTGQELGGTDIGQNRHG
jgi:hypothetical protein